MMNRASIFLMACAMARVPAAAQSGLAAPRAGWLEDASGGIRQVFGLAGNFWLGPMLRSDAVSSAFTPTGGAVKTAAAVILMDADGRATARFAAPGGPAVFGFSPTGELALIYFPARGALVRVRGARLAPVAVNLRHFGGAVLALAAPQGNLADLIVRRGGALWRLRVGLSDGAVISSTPLPGAREPVLMRSDDSLLFAEAARIVIRDASGNERGVDTAFDPGALAEMGSDWVRVTERGGTRQYALRLTPGATRIDQLPGAAR